jgi:hypothetical protein
MKEKNRPMTRCAALGTIFLMALQVAVPARGGDASQDLGTVKKVRSIISEAAFVVALDSKGDVPAIVAKILLKGASEELASAAQQETNDPRVAGRIVAANSEIRAHNAEGLQQIAWELLAIEKQDEQYR